MFGNFNNSFKTLIASSLILSASFFVQNSSALAGGFRATCEDIGLIDSVTLRAVCLDKNNNRIYSAITLTSYIANINGAFTWRRDGNYIASCTDVRLSVAPRFGKFFLFGTCRDERGRLQRAVIDLNEKVSNQNGIIAVDQF